MLHFCSSLFQLLIQTIVGQNRMEQEQEEMEEEEKWMSTLNSSIPNHSEIKSIIEFKVGRTKILLESDADLRVNYTRHLIFVPGLAMSTGQVYLGCKFCFIYLFGLEFHAICVNWKDLCCFGPCILPNFLCFHSSYF